VTYSTIIVGSGISGLSAAIVLAKHGRKPLVLDAHNIPGGCMQMFQRRAPGNVTCRFDTGVHYVGSMYPGQIMWRLFRYMGVEVPTQPLDRECFDRISFPSGDFHVPVGWNNVADALKRACPAESQAIDAYIGKMRGAEASLSWHTLNPGAEGAFDRGLHETSLQQLIDQLGASPRLRSLICAQSSLYAVPAAEVPLAVHAAVIGSTVEGPHYVTGGGDAITNPMVAKLSELGGGVRMRAPVRRVLAESGAAAGVELESGEVIHAPEVILAVHPRVAVKLLPQDAYRSALRERMAKAPECIAAFVVYGMVDDAVDLRGVAGRNHYLLREDDPDCFYRPEIEGAADAIVNLPPPAGGGPQLLSAMSSVRWEWFECWKNSSTRRRDTEYRKLKDKLTQNVMAMVEQRIPQLADNVLVIEASTPLTLRDYAGYPQGGIYGVQPSLQAQGRTGVRRRTNYRGLYLTGAGTGTPGILGACVTGFGVAGAILGTDALIAEVRDQTL
jgi:all-trans-retinol 13,14-reductase